MAAAEAGRDMVDCLEPFLSEPTMWEARFELETARGRETKDGSEKLVYM